MPRLAQKSFHRLAEKFFEQLCPWFQGDRYWLYKRFVSESCPADVSQLHALWLHQGYECAQQRYTPPNIGLARYTSLYHRYRAKISSELIVLWQYLNQPKGYFYLTEDFLQKYSKILSEEQQSHLRSYGPELPGFIRIFEGLSFLALSHYSLFEQQRPLIFSQNQHNLPLQPHHLLTFQSAAEKKEYAEKNRPLTPKLLNRPIATQ